MTFEIPYDYEWFWDVLSGADLSEQKAAQLEALLDADESDYRSRAKLLGYYSNRRKSKALEKKQVSHILWVLEHAPTCDLGKTPCLRFSKKRHPKSYAHAERLILQQCELYKSDPVVLSDLACIFVHEDLGLAEKLLKQAYSVSDGTHGIAFWLSNVLHGLGILQNNQSKLREAVAYMQKEIEVKQPSRKLEMQFWVAMYALDSGQYELASDTSKAMLGCGTHKDGQSEHVAHYVLGTIALKDGNIPLAVEHLISSGRVRSSPRLCSYGPMMGLAQGLLEAGERQSVINFLQDCKVFWDMGKRKLGKWIREIESGGTPTLKGDGI